MERERFKDREAVPLSDYEKMVRRYMEWDDRQRQGKLLIRGDEKAYQVTRQGYLKYYLNPLETDTAVSSWAVFEQLIERQWGFEELQPCPEYRDARSNPRESQSRRT